MKESKIKIKQKFHGKSYSFTHYEFFTNFDIPKGLVENITKQDGIISCFNHQRYNVDLYIGVCFNHRNLIKKIRRIIEKSATTSV